MTRLRAVPAVVWIVVGFACLALPLAFVLNVWQDEAYSLITTGGSLPRTVHQAIFFEQNAPLYFILLWAWRHLSESYQWARVLSVLCVAGTIALVPAIVRRYAPAVSPLAVTLAAAFNPLSVWAAVEIRSYALAMLLGAAVTLTGYDAFLCRPPRRYALPAFVAAAALAAYTQYFILFLVAGFGVVLLGRAAWKEFARYVAACVVMLLLFIPELTILPAQLGAFRTAYVGPSNIAAALVQLAKILFFQLFQIGELPHRGWIAAAILLAIVAGAIAGRHAFRKRGPVAAIALLVASALIYAAAVYVLKTHFDYRYGAFLFVPWIVAVFSCFGWWSPPAANRGAAAFAALMLCVGTAVLVHTYRSGAKIGDWRRVSAYLRSHVDGPQTILVFQAENAVPLAYYYHGPGRIVAIPRPVDFRSYDVDAFVVRDGSDVRRAIDAAGDPHDVWLVTAGACHSLNVRYGCDVVRDYVAAHYRTVDQAQFFHADVRRLKLR